jgi:hypothetical protein
MAGLLDIFGTGGTNALSLLGGGDIQSARDDAQAQALYALAGRMFQGGNTGASIAQGLQLGQQAYKQAMQSELQDRLQTYQLQEYAKKKQEEEAAKKREALAQQLMMKAYQPAQTEVTTETPMFDLQGNQLMGPNMPQAARPAGYNKDVVNQMLAFKEGQAALGNVAKIMPELRKAGMYGEQSGENPFAIFVNDPTVPAPLRATAAQYQKSYSAGALDQDTADKRFAELAQRIQSAQQFQQTQAGLEAQRQQSAAVQSILTQDRLDKIEQRKIEQAKPVTEAKESLNLLNQAEALLDSATGSLTGTAVDVVAGALGKSTPGAQATSKLKAIQGALVAKMPKMSGPQSDKDVLLYREMAGQVGDSMLPVETRKAAIETIREIQERYAKVEPGSSKPQEAQPKKSPFLFDAAKENRYQQWLKTQGKQ